MFCCFMKISCIIWTYIPIEYFYFKMKNIFPHIPKREIFPPNPQKISKYFAQWIKELVHSQKARSNIIISPLRNNLEKKSALEKPF